MSAQSAQTGILKNRIENPKPKKEKEKEKIKLKILPLYTADTVITSHSFRTRSANVYFGNYFAHNE